MGSVSSHKGSDILRAFGQPVFVVGVIFCLCVAAGFFVKDPEIDTDVFLFGLLLLVVFLGGKAEQLRRKLRRYDPAYGSSKWEKRIRNLGFILCAVAFLLTLI